MAVSDFPLSERGARLLDDLIVFPPGEEKIRLWAKLRELFQTLNPTDVAEAIDTLTDDVEALGEEERLNVAVAVAAEVDNARAVTLTCTNRAGDAFATANVMIELLRADGRPIDTSQQTIDLTTGTAITTGSPNSNGQILAQASAGTIVVVVTDKSTSYEGTVYLRLTSRDALMAPKYQAVVFA